MGISLLRHFLAIQLVGFQTRYAWRARTRLAALWAMVFGTHIVVGTNFHFRQIVAA